MGVVECCNGELKFVGYSDKGVEVGRFVTVDIDFDISSDHVGQDLPLEGSWEGRCLGFRRGTP